MTEKGDWVSTLLGLIQRMASTDVTELEVRQGNLRLRLRRDSRPVAASPISSESGIEVPSSHDQEGLHRVVAPLTGIYYAAASPTSKPYVGLGDWLERDTVVALIETMKVFNEVTADCRGRVAALLTQQGQLVHAGETLLLVDTAADPDRADEVA